MSSQPLVVAFCGLDRVGKTSLIDALRQRLPHDEYAVIGRGPAAAERLVEGRVPRRHFDHRDWTEGPFSRALTIACAIDYCLFYEGTIAPLLRGDSGSRALAVVTDRCALCFLAYADATQEPDPVAITLLESIPIPDLVFYVTASAASLAARPPPRDEFEQPAPQQLLAAAYQRVFDRLSIPVVSVDNSRALDDVLPGIVKHIRRAASARK